MIPAERDAKMITPKYNAHHMNDTSSNDEGLDIKMDTKVGVWNSHMGERPDTEDAIGGTTI